MSKAGKWRLGLYLKEKEYYCILESEEKASGESGGVYWESRSEKSDWGMPARLIMNGCPEAAILTVKGTFQTAPEPERAAGEGEADSCMAVRPGYRLLHGGSGHS